MRSRVLWQQLKMVRPVELCLRGRVPTRQALRKPRDYITEIDGKPCETYIDWFSITFALTMTSCPVISIPCGFTQDGLPVGLQVVGKPRGEANLSRAAKWIEAAFDISGSLPIDPRN